MEDKTLGNAVVPVVDPLDSTLISGASYVIEAGPFQAATLVIDIPQGVTCLLSVNGAALAKCDDQSGLSMALPYGDLTKRTYTVLRTVRLEGVNQAQTVKTIRAWVVQPL